MGTCVGVHTRTWLCTNMGMCIHVHTCAWLCTNMVMYVPTRLCAGLRYVSANVCMCRGYVPTWLCPWLCLCVHGYAPCVVMCVHVYVCSHGHGYVWLCPCVVMGAHTGMVMSMCAYVHWLCLLCYVMLCLLCTHPPAVTIVYTSINILSSLYLRQHKKNNLPRKLFFFAGLDNTYLYACKLIMRGRVFYFISNI